VDIAATGRAVTEVLGLEHVRSRLYYYSTRITALRANWTTQKGAYRSRRPCTSWTKTKRKARRAAELFLPVTSFPRNRANLESQAVEPQRMAAMRPTERLSEESPRLLWK
jgi:hypothetical protein